MASSNLKRKADERVRPSKVDSSGLMETDGDKLFLLKAPTNAGTQVGSEGVKGPTPRSFDLDTGLATWD